MHDLAPVSELLVALARFVMELQVAVGAAASLNWHFRPTPHDWSLAELACHLRDVEREVHQPRFRALIATDNAFIPGADSDSWVVERNYQAQDGVQALAQFAAARQDTLVLLQPLPAEMWQRRGRHAFFGPTSMHELLNLVAQHDQAHRQQARALLR